MAIKFCEGAKHASMYFKFRPVTPASVITKIITFLQEKISPPLQHALDVGCGSGQSTTVLAPYFQKVTGIDVSEVQITEASNNALPNIEYKMSPVEKMPFHNESVQLITASQSAHWFNLPGFYSEADRLLVPFGVLSLYGYDIPLPFHQNETIKKNAQKVVLEVYDDLHDYFLPQRAIVDNKYKDIILPYDNYIRTSVNNEIQCKFSDYIGYFKTWSGYQRLNVEDPKKAELLINKMNERLCEALKIQSIETSLAVVIEYFIIMGRKPGNNNS